MELHSELSINTCVLILAELNSKGIFTDSKLHAVFNSADSSGGTSEAVLHQAIRGAISSLLSDPVNASEVVRVLERIGKCLSLVEAVRGTEPQSGNNDVRPQGKHWCVCTIVWQLELVNKHLLSPLYHYRCAVGRRNVSATEVVHSSVFLYPKRSHRQRKRWESQRSCSGISRGSDAQRACLPHGTTRTLAQREGHFKLLHRSWFL